jgi:hypothetical protein
MKVWHLSASISKDLVGSECNCGLIEVRNGYTDDETRVPSARSFD